MTTRKNTARSQDIRGPHAPTSAKPAHLHLVSDKAARMCVCGKEIVGNHKTCGQCNLLDQAKILGQELFTCMVCETALTPFDFCWHCNRLPADVKASARKAYDAKQPASTPAAEPKATKTVETSTQPAAKQPELLKTTVIETDDATIEYRELNANEAFEIKLDADLADEVEERQKRDEEYRLALAARKAEEAREAARVAEVRSLLRKAYEEYGVAILKAVDVQIFTKTEIEIDGKKYADPHFTARYQNISCDFHDKDAADAIKKARKDLAERLEAAAKTRREAEAAARRAKHAPKKDEPKPGKSGGKGKDGKPGKGNKSGGKGKK